MTSATIQFDQILETSRAVLAPHLNLLPEGTLLNRDLTSRVRLVVPSASINDNETTQHIKAIAAELSRALSPHSYPPEHLLLWEDDLELARYGAHLFPLFVDTDRVQVADRLMHGSSWSRISDISNGAPRIVFFSVKGGVGRSTALSALAWDLSAGGKRVMVVDLDLESPGISTYLLPQENQPSAGIVDWLVEDLVDNGDALLPDLYSLSPSAPDGEIIVVPAHGVNPGEYISKLGRAWMTKGTGTAQEAWEQRLDRLLRLLEDAHRPDVILIDSRSGLDDVASNAIASLGARMTLLFATDDEQSWRGYGSLFNHWLRTGVAPMIRDRLQVVAALVPEEESFEHTTRVRGSALDLFESTLYDAVDGDETTGAESFSFIDNDEFAPHFPWAVRWNRGIRSLRSVSDGIGRMDPSTLDHTFGPLLTGVKSILTTEEEAGQS
ncbi:KGGVGR-motif variant AAA ATPase [Brachybacterium sp. 107]|uniref:KGGVGR-motif variant AAA ATPase n=1 Tax=Brachybacterium sp. 107 TaxID=3457736 RepID=UPI0040331C95